VTRPAGAITLARQMRSGDDSEDRELRAMQRRLGRPMVCSHTFVSLCPTIRGSIVEVPPEIRVT